MPAVGGLLDVARAEVHFVVQALTGIEIVAPSANSVIRRR